MRRLCPRDGAPLHLEQARRRALEVRDCWVRQNAGGGNSELMLNEFVRSGIGHPLNGIVWKGEREKWMASHGCDGCHFEGRL